MNEVLYGCGCEVLRRYEVSIELERSLGDKCCRRELMDGKIYEK